MTFSHVHGIDLIIEVSDCTSLISNTSICTLGSLSKEYVQEP